jgi:hypothetical protein
LIVLAVFGVLIGLGAPAGAAEPVAAAAPRLGAAAVPADSGPVRFVALATPVRMIDTGNAVGAPTAILAAQTPVTSQFIGRSGVPAAGVGRCKKSESGPDEHGSKLSSMV